MNTNLEEKLKTLPRSSGVYFHKSKNGEIIYVGKAAVLKNRVRQYFQTARNLDTKTIALVNEIYDTDWVETESEIDALFLESEMVKRYMPRYNILLRDDKSQMFVRIDMKNEWPHVSFTRNPSDDKAEYFGPFYNGYALKKALRYLRKVFPYYVKEDGKETSKLDEDLGLSPKKSENSELYKQNLHKLISYIKGNRKSIVTELEKEMKRYASEQNFEMATVVRNKIYHMKELQRRVMFGDREFLDISKDRALNDLVTILGLKKMPARIEGYDISHMGGTNVVASMVVFTNGVSDRANYRKFKTKLETNNDTYNMHETLFRRLSEKNLTSWGKPDLILIDGGKGQLDAAMRAMEERNVAIPTVSIAKREEELLVHISRSHIDTGWIMTNIMKNENVNITKSGEYFIVNLHPGQRNASAHSKNLRGGSTFSTYSDVIKLFQRIRDESHRFAVSYHTVLKRAGQHKSQLSDIPEVGPATQKKLIKAFGSVRGIKIATKDQLTTLIGEKKAKNIARYFIDDK